MRIKIKLLSLALAGAFVLSNGNMALAKEYFYDEAINDLPQSTSVSLPEVIGGEDIYQRDVSKNAAILPPPFGSPQAAQPNSGTIINANTGTNYTPTVPPILYPTEQESIFFFFFSLGTLTIPALDLAVKVYEGEENLSKGVGHFADTPLWQGNVAIAGHNRGVNSYFGEIHTLNWGDKLIYSTKFGTKTYQVQTVRKIKATDFTFLKETADNRLTLITCVKNEPNYRWCVQAKEVS